MSGELTSPVGARRALVPLLLRWGLAAIALFALVLLVQRGDLQRAWALLARLGWPAAFVLLPTLAAMMLDAGGWRSILSTLGHRVSWRRLLGLRLSVEALVLALPGGSLAGEAAKLALLRRSGVPVPAGAASLALTKLILIGTDAAYLTLAGGLLCVAIGSGSQIARLPALLCFAGAAITAVATVALALTLRRSTAASAIARRLALLPIGFLARWFERRLAQAEALDGATRSHFAAPFRARLAAGVPFALEWLCEGIETLIILACLGVHIGIGQALALDGLGSLLRALVFFVPAGLGIQDAAQVMLLAGLGVPDPLATGAAFVVVKRTKEIFWIAIGALLWTAKRGSWNRAAEDRRNLIPFEGREGGVAC